MHIKLQRPAKLAPELTPPIVIPPRTMRFCCGNHLTVTPRPQTHHTPLSFKYSISRNSRRLFQASRESTMKYLAAYMLLSLHHANPTKEETKMLFDSLGSILRRSVLIPFSRLWMTRTSIKYMYPFFPSQGPHLTLAADLRVTDEVDGGGKQEAWRVLWVWCRGCGSQRGV